MGWHAKPSGAYEFTSGECKDNIYEMNKFFNNRAYTLQSQAGIIGNAYAESGLNPWRWESDHYDTTGGYGLFQFTPASGYIDGCSHLENYAPNLSVSSVTHGANPNDGVAQLTAFADNTLNKWVDTCWRSYWDTTVYADLYEIRTRILNTYGDGNSLTLEQFKGIKDVYDATFVFLACYEGPAVPNMNERFEYASSVYENLSGDTPDQPDTPVPSTSRHKGVFFNSKFAVLLRRRMM